LPESSGIKTDDGQFPSLVSDSETSTANTQSSMSQKPSLFITIPPRSHLSHVSSPLTRPLHTVGLLHPERLSTLGLLTRSRNPHGLRNTRSSRLSKPVPNLGFRILTFVFRRVHDLYVALFRACPNFIGFPPRAGALYHEFR
jgi:hypothetical protein